MKIFYLSDSTVPSRSANSVHVMKMCNAFGALGHEVTLIAYKGSDTADVYDYYCVTPCFDIREIQHSTIPGVRRVLRAIGGAQVQKRHRTPDLIYGRDLYSMLAASRLGLPMIYESHMGPQSLMDRYLTARMLRAGNLRRLVVISDVLAKDYISLYPSFDQQRLMVAHDGADAPDQNAFTGKVNWPGRKKAIQAGYVGSLYPGKGADTVVALAARLPDIDFHIVGGKPEEVATLRSTFCGSNLYMHGYVPHREVRHHLACLDIALLPAQHHVHLSRTLDIGRWMSPLKLFEYMASRLPIVGSRLPVIEEVLAHNVNALLVKAEALDSWTEAVAALAADQGLREKLANRAYSDFTDVYTWRARAHRVLADIVG